MNAAVLHSAVAESDDAARGELAPQLERVPLARIGEASSSCRSYWTISTPMRDWSGRVTSEFIAIAAAQVVCSECVMRTSCTPGFIGAVTSNVAVCVDP